MKRTAKVIISVILVAAMSAMMLMPALAADVAEAETKATALKQLRLFKGVSATDFDLDRAPSRTEALVMLIRVLGKESEAQNGSFSHPFTDVSPWADKYVGYAYQNGLTKGVSATQLGAGDANSDMYLTFVLRALNYDDSAGDFAWNEPDSLARTAGILTDSVNTSDFLRADVAIVSWAALEAKLKDSSQTLSQKLIDFGAFTSDNYAAAKSFASVNGGALVSTVAELKSAMENKEIDAIQIGSDLDITENFFFERDDSPVIYIREGITLTITNEFIPVGFNIINDGAIAAAGTFDRGLGSLINNGSVTVKNGGTFCSGMTSTYNYGTVTAEAGGNLLIERGTQFINFGKITNDGYISVNNGGSLDNAKGAIINNGAMDLASYFGGDVSKITGTGTINDTRE